MVSAPPGPRGVAVRLFLTVFLVYAAHFASNVVRETYLAMALGEHLSVRVDEYLGLHPDLFEIAGRGAYINNNPGASVAGAVPYALARPALALLFRWKPGLVAPKPAATYDDPRPNRNRFMNEARARGLDVKLALAALIMQVGLMAPIGALAAVVMFRYLRARLGDDRPALWLALLYAVGTPIFFRSAFLNQNALMAHYTLFAFAGVTWPGADAGRVRRMEVWAGLWLGLALLTDYSAAPLIMAFGVWRCWEGWRAEGLRGAFGAGLRVGAGAAGPVALLFLYQWMAFGHPLFPAQRYMPPTQFSVRGWNGMTLPTADLLWRNLLDPRYGLFAFSPMLAAAFAAPWVRERRGAPAAGELGFIAAAFAAVWLFNSANQFASLQWNTGVRYMVPLVPLLFLALVPVLLALPAAWRWVLVAPTLVISWAVAMARESVPESLARLATRGLELPFLTVLEKTAAAYAPVLARGSWPFVLAAYGMLGLAIAVVWRWGRERGARAGAADMTA